MTGERIEQPGEFLPLQFCIACGAEACKPLPRCRYRLPDDVAAMYDSQLAARSDSRAPLPAGPPVVVQRSVRRARAQREKQADAAHPRVIFVYRNADEVSDAVRVSVNRRMFPTLARLYSYLDRVVRLVEGRVSHLAELTTGQVVTSVDEIADGFSYAACGGAVPFRRVAYKPVPSIVEPVEQLALRASLSFGSPERRSLLGLAKARNIVVFRNGDADDVGEVVAVHRKMFRTMDAFLTYLSSKLGLVSGVRRLHTVGGIEVTRVEDIADGKCYVACGPETYRDVAYAMPDQDGDGIPDALDPTPLGASATLSQYGDSTAFSRVTAGDDGFERFAYLDSAALQPGTQVIVVPDRIRPRAPPRTWSKV